MGITEELLTTIQSIKAQNANLHKTIGKLNQEIEILRKELHEKQKPENQDAKITLLRQLPFGEQDKGRDNQAPLFRP